MQATKTTVPGAVRAIIMRNPNLYQCLKMKVLNYNAVAHLIAADVERMVGKSVNPNTIVAALVRFSGEVEKEKLETPPSPLGDAKLNLVTGVSDITITCPAAQQRKLVEKILDMAAEGDHSVRVNQFPTYIKVATNSTELERRIKGLKKEIPEMTEEKHAELHVRLSADAILTPGAMAFITDTLFRNGVSAMNAFFANEDAILTIDEESASKAFESLRSEISRLAQSLEE